MHVHCHTMYVYSVDGCQCVYMMQVFYYDHFSNYHYFVGVCD